ncbi:DUF6916 family protein [Sphingosinicella terrae]|jgi:hypothetical protein|uniref:DUF6916 family protein n=1 Tax=Sphingosinicella terrae TaxID=2172047 RepID=UPI000E0CCEDA|nr:hypothetical protein [Sphingosinicella terrae]
MEDLTFDDFQPLESRSLPVAVGDEAVQLRLDSVEALPASARAAGAFRLEFVGPSQPLLTQGTYEFDLGSERREIFIVPIGLGQDGARYEAVFF